MKTIAPAERVLRRVSTREPDECWKFLGSTDKNGYGQVGVKIDGKATTRRAHRLVYEFLVGPIPDGLVIDHLCREPGCVNPAHLEAVTPRENIMRGEGVAAKHAATSHCPQGHLYDEGNTYIHPMGKRYCRTCARERMARKRTS